MAGTCTLGQVADSGGVWGTIGSTLVGTVGPIVFAYVVTAASTIIWGIENDKDYPQSSWTVINDAFYEAFSGWAWLWVGRNTNIDDDLLVHKDSQLATGYTGIAQTYHKRFVHGGFGSTVNFDGSRTSAPTFGVAHNLEARDDDFINWIMARINTNFKIFNTSFSGGGISINGFSENIKIPNDINFTVPETLKIGINNYNVVAIGNNAFINQKQLTQITIPYSITNISNTAFKGCTNLSSVIIPWEWGFAAREICTHTSKVNYMIAESYHWKRCTSCYETFGDLHQYSTSVKRHTCVCGLDEECDVAFTTTKTHHNGTCKQCNVKYNGLHLYTSQGDNMVCFYCGISGGFGPGIISIPLDSDEFSELCADSIHQLMPKHLT